MLKNKRGFASDNNSGVHPAVMEAMSSVNEGHVVAYGDDPYTAAAIGKIKKEFGQDTGVFFVFTGTAANVLGLKASTENWNSVICADTAHIHCDECGAPEFFTGCKLLTVSAPDGKLTVDLVRKHMHGFDFEHHAQPRVISVTQATEMGTVYTPDELREICDYAHGLGLLVHMDGARICNAAAGPGISFRKMTADVGIDVLSFGGTKNGLMYGEAIVFFNASLSRNFKYVRKQGMQLASKMRYIAAQFDALLTDELWLKNAGHANMMARLLADEVSKIPGIKITQKVQINGVFAVVPPAIVPELQKEFFFYVWNP
ncbi:MAG: beta-eliminating lyase-related protein, partial [Bacteroidales bacterium]